MPKIFGLCFGFPSGGALLLGDAPLPPGVAPPVWTPLLPASSQYYAVKLLAVEVEVQLPIGAGAGSGGGGGGGGGAGGTVSSAPLVNCVLHVGRGEAHACVYVCASA
jgi:hypothetical protein